MMLISIGKCQYAGRYAALNISICHFWDRPRARFPGKIQSTETYTNHYCGRLLRPILTVHLRLHSKVLLYIYYNPIFRGWFLAFQLKWLFPTSHFSFQLRTAYQLWMNFSNLKFRKLNLSNLKIFQLHADYSVYKKTMFLIMYECQMAKLGPSEIHRTSNRHQMLIGRLGPKNDQFWSEFPETFLMEFFRIFCVTWLKGPWIFILAWSKKLFFILEISVSIALSEEKDTNYAT